MKASNELVHVLAPDGTANEEVLPDVSNKEMVRWYDIMVTLRALDEKGMKLQRQGRIGFHIPTTGQEAHVGAAAAMQKDDWIFPAYREHGAALYRGLQLSEIVDQFFGNERDPQKGRRLPGLFGSKQFRFVSPSAPIGTQIIHAVGAAYASKFLKDGTATLVFFGDGATSSNDFHSGMTFAKVFEVPAVLVCQNNRYAISMPVAHQTGAKNIVDKAIGYGMTGVQVDGNDILALYRVVHDAAERARKESSPTFIESLTYRLGPHTSSDDPTRYRSDAEVKKWEKLEPIGRFRKYLITQGIMTKDEAEKIDSDRRNEIDELVKAAAAVPKPPLESMFTDVYEDMPWHLKEQLAELKHSKEGGE